MNERILHWSGNVCHLYRLFSLVLARFCARFVSLALWKVNINFLVIKDYIVVNIRLSVLSLIICINIYSSSLLGKKPTLHLILYSFVKSYHRKSYFIWFMNEKDFTLIMFWSSLQVVFGRLPSLAVLGKVNINSLVINIYSSS